MPNFMKTRAAGPRPDAQSEAGPSSPSWSIPALDGKGAGRSGARGESPPGRALSTSGAAPYDDGNSSEEIHELKNRLHRQLLERLNLATLGQRNREEAELEVGKLVRQMIVQENTPLNMEERELVVEQVVYEIFGLGPLEPLLKDPSISDILVNGCKSVYIERNGRLEPTDVVFKNDQHLLQVIDRIVSAVGRRIDDSSPMVDARLQDGSRVNAIIPPLALDGPHISIRKFRRDVLSAEDLLRSGSVTEAILEFVRGAVKARLNILISGGTGSGKTTFLNMLSEAIPDNERIVTIEDSAELQLRQPHTVRLETRPPNIEGQGAVGQRQLVINALRMRPDRIIVGEVRGAEALDMLQAMNTGHDGSLTTLHANSPRDALGRLDTMVQMAGLTIGEQALRRQVASAIDLVIHLSRLSDGGRRVMNVSEIVGMEGEIISMQDLFVFDRKGIDEDGKVIGNFRATGIRPKSAEQLQAAGIDLEATLFAGSTVGRR
jgi:pilus assembly protein CpaF